MDRAATHLFDIMEAMDLLWKEANTLIRDPCERLKHKMSPDSVLAGINQLIKLGYAQKGASLRTSYLTEKGSKELRSHHERIRTRPNTINKSVQAGQREMC